MKRLALRRAPRAAFRYAALAILGLGLAGCLSSVPVKSLIELSKLDPLASDPGAMRFALRTPDGLRVRDGDATVTLSFAEENGPTIGGHWSVRRLDVPLPPDMAENRRAGADLGLFALSAADASDMRRMQAAILARKAAGVEGEGTFTVFIGGCREANLTTFAAGPVPTSAFLQTAPDRSFVPLFVDVDLRAALAADGVDLADAPACDGA